MNVLKTAKNTKLIIFLQFNRLILHAPVVLLTSLTLYTLANNVLDPCYDVAIQAP